MLNLKSKRNKIIIGITLLLSLFIMFAIHRQTKPTWQEIIRNSDYVNYINTKNIVVNDDLVLFLAKSNCTNAKKKKERDVT